MAMKRCPTCRQVFGDDALNFCRFDGAPLFFDRALLEAPTIPLAIQKRRRASRVVRPQKGTKCTRDLY